jgi:hypothetical protein
MSALIVLYFVFFVAMAAGYISNIIWLFNMQDITVTGEFILAVVGVVLGPLGALHGIWTWF